MRERTHFYIYFHFFYINQQLPLSIIYSFREWDINTQVHTHTHTHTHTKLIRQLERAIYAIKKIK